MNNVGGGLDQLRRKEEVLLRHCETVGRDPSEIERTTGIGTVFIRDDRAEAERLFREAFERNRVASHWTDQPVGTRRGRGREARAVRGARLPAPHRRHARAVRRGVDDPLRDRGQAAARARASRPRSRRSTPASPSAPPAARFARRRAHLRPVAARWSCRTSGGGRRATCPRTPSDRRRWRRSGSGPSSPAAIASTSGAVTRASASPVGSAASWRWPTTTPARAAWSSACGVWARTRLSVVDGVGSHGAPLDGRVPDLAKGRADVATRSSHASSPLAAWARSASLVGQAPGREVRHAVVGGEEVLLRGRGRAPGC